MMDFLFFVKTLVVCLLITLALQVKFDEMTLEAHAQKFVTSSMVVAPLQSVAHGGAKLIKDITRQIYAKINHNVKPKKEEELGSAKASSFRWSGDEPSQNETAVDESYDGAD